MYMSRLSALKEYSFLKVLWENGFCVPEPVAQNRHTVVMELVDAVPLRQVQRVPDPAGLYADLIGVILRLAGFGLIHGDFNEFNILLREDELPDYSKDIAEADIPEDQLNQIQNLNISDNPKTSDTTPNPTNSNPQPPAKITPIIIDFPQMVSIDHLNAQMYFDRDVNCIKRFFERRFNFVSAEPGPFLADAKRLAGGKKNKRLDVEVEASGFSKKMAKELEKYVKTFEALEGEDRGELQGSDDGEDQDAYSDSDTEHELLAHT